MTIIVASLFLPYNVQFEVDKEHESTLKDEDSIADLLEIVEKPSRSQSSVSINNLDHNQSLNSLRKYTHNKHDISIIDSLVNNMILDDHIAAAEGDQSGEPRDEGAAHEAGDEDDLSSLSSSEFELVTDRIHSLHSANKHSKVSTPQNLSVQDFFFNNPYTNRQHSLSVGSTDDNPLVDMTAPSLLGSVNSNPQHLNTSNSNVSINSQLNHNNTVIKPKAMIRNQSPQINLTSAKKANSIETPQLSSMRIRRSSHRRDAHGHGLLMNSLDATNSATSSKVNLNSLKKAGENNADSKYNLNEELNKEEDDILGYTNKISPFGGFSRPQMELLEQNNLFSIAPWHIIPFDKGNGSLFKAVESAREDGRFNEAINWIGAISTPSNVIPDKTKNDISKELKMNHHSNVIFFDDEKFRGHYHSFCKEILWPIFHYQIPDDPKSNAFENHSWNDYEQINRQFAEEIAKIYKEGDTVWIHDYHLMLVPNFLRKLLPNAKIGFFLHISFPSSEVFRCLAQRNNILEGILGADCISFQTEEYLGHFLQSCNRLLLADFDDKTVYYKGNASTVSFDPIGLCYKKLDLQLKSHQVLEWRKLIRQRWNNKMLIVNRDKMDAIRGVKEKLLAYERFLNDNPKYLNSVTMILICLRSKVDEAYENKVFSIVERINAKTNGISNDQPVVILHQDIEFEQYLALLAEANLFVVSTLREGMNLTCHEFICATQEKHSPLILSEFVGSADVLTNGPILVNPYNIRQVSEAILHALTMSNEEKFKNWENSFKKIVKYESQSWIANCLNDLNNSFNVTQNHKASLLKTLNNDEFNSLYSSVNKNNDERIFVLNLDELTTNLVIEGKVIHSVQQQLINTTLSNLTANKLNSVYILSYHERSELIRRYRRVQDLGFIAENGGYIKPPHLNKWFAIFEDLDCNWKKPIQKVMKAFGERIPNSHVDIYDCAVKFHVSGAKDIDNDHKNSLVGDLITHINELYTKDFNIHASLIKGNVIVQEQNLISKSLSIILNKKIGPLKRTSSSASFSSLNVHSVPMSPNISSFSTNNKLTNDEDKLEFEKPKFKLVLAFGGSSHIDEEVYEIINDNATESLSVRVGQIDSGTCANNSLQGINELMLILKNC